MRRNEASTAVRKKCDRCVAHYAPLKTSQSLVKAHVAGRIPEFSRNWCTGCHRSSTVTQRHTAAHSVTGMVFDTEPGFRSHSLKTMNIECLDIRPFSASRARIVALLLRLREATPSGERPETWALVPVPGCPGEYAIVSASGHPHLEVSEEHLTFVESMDDVDIAAYLEAAFE